MLCLIHCLTGIKVGWQSQMLKLKCHQKCQDLKWLFYYFFPFTFIRQILILNTVFTESALKLPLYHSGKTVFIHFLCLMYFPQPPALLVSAESSELKCNSIRWLLSRSLCCSCAPIYSLCYVEKQTMYYYYTWLPNSRLKWDHWRRRKCRKKAPETKTHLHTIKEQFNYLLN